MGNALAQLSSSLKSRKPIKADKLSGTIFIKEVKFVVKSLIEKTSGSAGSVGEV